MALELEMLEQVRQWKTNETLAKRLTEVVSKPNMPMRTVVKTPTTPISVLMGNSESLSVLRNPGTRVPHNAMPEIGHDVIGKDQE